MKHLRLATRASPLALWQARHAATLLRQTHPGLRVTLVPVTSHGDRDLTTPLHAMGGVGVFCKEVHALVLAGEADAGVHSCKDLPTTEPDGLVLAAILRRADPRDALVGATALDALPMGAVIGTSSTRRRAQLSARRPDLSFIDLRGNVQTRLAKIARGDAVATCMAVAGLRRLGLSTPHARAILDPWRDCTPAPGQGAVAIDCRQNDHRTRWLIEAIAHRDTAIAIDLERRVLAGLAGGCSLPLGCLAHRADGLWRMTARLGLTGGTLREVHLAGPAAGLPERMLDALRA
jgi:hydroxymethylbilane synthase